MQQMEYSFYGTGKLTFCVISNLNDINSNVGRIDRLIITGKLMGRSSPTGHDHEYASVGCLPAGP